MSVAITKWVLGLLSAAVLALGGWVYATGSRLTAVEVKADVTTQNIQDIRNDLRDLRNTLLGPRENPSH